MQLVASRRYPAIDAQTLTEYFACDTLFRIADGSYCLYMESKDQAESKERILLLGCRDALLWLNETVDAVGSHWHFAASENRRYLPQYGT